MSAVQSAAARIADLLATHCPDGVEYKAVKDVYTRLKGTPITARKMKEIASHDGEIKVFAGGKTVINAHAKDIPHANIVDVPAVLIQSRGMIDAIYYERPFTFKNEMWAYTADDKDSVKYLYYVIKNNIEIFRNAAAGMGALPQISLSVTEDFQIPVPPLAVQREIVRILDTFTALTTELQTERAQRLRQYEYYRDMLLSEGYLKQATNRMNSRHSSLQRMTLGDIGKVCMCKRVLKSQTSTDEEVPFYKIGTFGKIADTFISRELFNRYRELYSFPKQGDVLISASGTIGRIVIYQGEDAYFQDSNIVWIDNDEKLVQNRYLYYFYSTHPWKVTQGGTIARLYMGDIEKVPILVPPLGVQRQVVGILDKLERICRDVTAGLPREMALRERQYAYYRERLLTWPRRERKQGG